jgi:hypothetical protein
VTGAVFQNNLILATFGDVGVVSALVSFKSAINGREQATRAD